ATTPSPRRWRACCSSPRPGWTCTSTPGAVSRRPAPPSWPTGWTAAAGSIRPCGRRAPTASRQACAGVRASIGWPRRCSRGAPAGTRRDARDEHTGRRLAATALRTGWAELRWSPRGHGDADALDLFVAASGNSRIAADDANTAWAPGHASIDIGIERRWRMGGLPLRAWLRIDNVLDRGIVGSVIVNEGNGRYFEPAPGRTLQLGLAFGAAP